MKTTDKNQNKYIVFEEVNYKDKFKINGFIYVKLNDIRVKDSMGNGRNYNSFCLTTECFDYFSPEATVALVEVELLYWNKNIEEE